MKFEKKELVKSPLNYTGGKFKLLPQILPLFPDDIGTFVDLFGGGCNVGINIKANKIIYNEINENVFNLIDYLIKNKYDDTLVNIQTAIGNYNLNKENADGYLKLREHYNLDIKNNKTLFLFVLIAHSFSNQIRFNKKGEFNMPFGKRTFNNNMQKNLKEFMNKIQKKEIKIYNKDFKKVNIENLNKGDLIYCDPPYLTSCATYNEQGGWNRDREKELLDYLNTINKNNIKFALSNVFENKGKKNGILIKWCEDNKDKYRVHYLNHTYGNCNYHAKDKNTNGTIEVLVTNY